jgi:DNA-binding transcriptional ArsR family regulator
MPEVNSVGDLVLTEAGAMRALADPDRLALLDRLRRSGPATTAELGDVSEHLGELEHFGLLTRSGDEWSAVGKGFAFEIPDEPEGQAAGRALSKAMLLHYLDVPRKWVVDDEPELELEWVRAAGLLNARVALTAGELRHVQEGLERLLEPFLTREPDVVPAKARPVRILSYFLP